jgi:excisionase family DNA binding protein
VNNEYMTITEVASRLGVATKTIVRWEQSGRIQKSKRDYRGWRIYSVDDVQAIERLVNAIY